MRAPSSRVWAEFGASRQGEKGLQSSRVKNARHDSQWGGGLRATLLHYVIPDLSYYYCGGP